MLLCGRRSVTRAGSGFLRGSAAGLGLVGRGTRRIRGGGSLRVVPFPLNRRDRKKSTEHRGQHASWNMGRKRRKNRGHRFTLSLKWLWRTAKYPYRNVPSGIAGTELSCRNSPLALAGLSFTLRRRDLARFGPARRFPATNPHGDHPIDSRRKRAASRCGPG